jgi:hypothetical protein
MLKDVEYMLDMRVKRLMGPMPADPATVISTLERLHAAR